MAIDVYALRGMLADAAAKWDAGARIPAASAMVKQFGLEAVGRVTDRALLVHGGIGYTRKHPIERLYRDAWLNWLEEGSTPTIQYMVTARELLSSYRFHDGFDGIGWRIAVACERRDRVVATRERYEGYWRRALDRGYTFLWFEPEGEVSPEELADEFLDSWPEGPCRQGMRPSSLSISQPDSSTLKMNRGRPSHTVAIALSPSSIDICVPGSRLRRARRTLANAPSRSAPAFTAHRSRKDPRRCSSV
ncbi:acyl-CoA dehydrogenase family protein [Streptomyces sp. KR55]|uniref:acyl-CoA dehydrogenase family protein n=1 Tax=Streptomyces sp. KR55 TaxID=3457425 RepID=UPI003FD46CE3